MDRLFRPVPSMLNGAGRRHMGGAPGADHAATARLWKYVTFGGTAISLAWAAKELMEHEEDEEYKPVPYRNINQKALPWGDGKTPLFVLAGGWSPEKESHH